MENRESIQSRKNKSKLIKSKGRLWWVGIPILLVVIVSFSSLNDNSKNTYWFGQTDYTSELVKAYNTLAFYTQHGALYTIVELSSDELVIPARGGDWYDGGSNINAHKHTFLPSDQLFNNAWQQLYSGIVICNKQLFQYDKITTSDVNGYRAELKVLRAYYYYLLLDNFGRAPLIVDYFPKNPTIPSANTSAELYAFIESEITSNLANLSAAKVYGRFNQSAAKALLAKLYLNANKYIATPKWTQVVTLCDDITNSGLYSLAPDYFTSFYVNNHNSPEIIFQIPYDSASLPGFNMGQMTLHYESQHTFNFAQQPWNGYASVEDFYNSFQAGDARKGQFLAGPQVDINNNPLVDPVNDGDPDGTTINFTPAISNINNAYRQAGVRINKWKYKLGGGTQMDNDFAIFRYSDVLLMKAEAKLQLGDQATALILINQIRTRAGLSSFTTFSTTALALDALLAERGREFFAETWRRQDLIRFGKFNLAWWEKLASPSYVNIFPIPSIQLQNNPNLTQNPGY